MKALVVYESIFGTTKEVAAAIAAGLKGAFAVVDLVEVGVAPTSTLGVDLLVVGGPTHVFAMSRPGTRRSGVEQAAKQGLTPPSQGNGVREWLDALQVSPGLAAAAFDTAAGRYGIFSGGSAARGIAKRLQHKGYRIVAAPEQFIIKVVDAKTSLKDGEAARAQRWGERLADLARSRTAA